MLSFAIGLHLLQTIHRIFLLSLASLMHTCLALQDLKADVRTMYDNIHFPTHRRAEKIVLQTMHPHVFLE